MFENLKEMVLEIRKDIDGGNTRVNITGMKWDINFLAMIGKITEVEKQELLDILEPPVVEVIEETPTEE